MKHISRRSFLISILAIVLSIVLAACGAPASNPDASDTGAAKEGGKGTIGVLMPSLNTELFVTMSDSITDSMKEIGYSCNVQSMDMDASKAVTVIENFITDGVAGIVYVTNDTSGDDALKKAMDAGIPVLTMGVENENYDVCIVNDNETTGYMIGEMAADYINKNFGGSCQVAYITSTKSPEMIDRVNGYRAAMEELCPGAEIVYEMECVDAGQGTAFAENLNTLYPDCKVVLSYTDSFAKEVSETWTALGYPKDAAIFGHDGESPVLADIAADGYTKGTVLLMDAGPQIRDIFVDFLNGKYQTHTLLGISGEAITIDNVAEYTAQNN